MSRRANGGILCTSLDTNLNGTWDLLPDFEGKVD